MGQAYTNKSEANMNRFHQELYTFIYDLQPEVVVETGFATGKSAMQILAAMDANDKGSLYSVECFVNQPIFHPRLNFYRGMSHDHLVPIFLKSGPWDVFLHDSDHEVGCQTFEYELAWAFLKPGGVLMSDDFEWSNHRAWARFCTRHDAKSLTFGTVAYCRKPEDMGVAGSFIAAYNNAKAITNAVCNEVGAELYFR